MKYILEYSEFNELTVEEQDIKDKAILDDTFLKAPNGKKTKLNEKQWLQVRTKNFINWFGDWLNDPENASKVIDNNGEPLIVYHGSQNNNMLYFDENRPAYFTSSKKTAKSFADRSFMGEFLYDDEIPTLYNVFLSIKKPEMITTEEEYEDKFQDVSIDSLSTLEKGYDGMIYKDKYIREIYYLTIKPFQIKSATNNNGDFNPINKNINN